MAVFANPFALWRIYLHPAQQAMADGRFGGPVRVTGGPGTGKTVVALHRARRLAERGAGRVLVTTFSANLAATMTINFGLLVEDAPTRSRVDITNVDKLAHQIAAGEHGRLVILGDREQTALWEDIMRRLDVDLPAAFLADEWRHVMLAQQLTTLEEYQLAKRPGRGQRIGPRQKERIWSAVCAFEEELARSERWTHETVVREAARLLRQRVDKPYRHVIVDEAQDLSPDQWRMLRAAVAHGGDDMFIAGDPHQRIYDNRVSLREVGVNVTGRSRRLSINYRTTAEILGWSLALLRGEQIDDMMGSLDSIAGCRSDVHGGMPTVIGSSSVAAEVRQIVNTVRRWEATGIALKEIGIAVRAKWLGERIEKQLGVADIDAELLGRARHTHGVAVATMHKMKGLEFRCVIVAGVSAGQVPAPVAVTPVTEDAHKHGLDMQRERCLLFVACTRAREELVVTWHGEPSEFLPRE
jgi:superfamily I DNA/RNA helicase